MRVRTFFQFKRLDLLATESNISCLENEETLKEFDTKWVSDSLHTRKNGDIFLKTITTTIASSERETHKMGM
jgi:hypothetical protein